MEAQEPKAPASRTRGGPRDRVRAAADDLFAREGIPATGVNLLIERADVAKASFYHAFKSKNDLVDDYLERQHNVTLGRLRLVEESDDPLAVKMGRVFDLLSTAAAQSVYRGCAFVVAATEMPQADLPAQKWARTHKLAVLATIRKMIEKAGSADAAEISEQIAIVYDGALVTAAIRPDSAAIERGRAMALAILAAHNLAS
ncbi:TetR/AcrR family transcriptional regulator [Streptomyces muensis]|uniref:TetR/AcrR family transcriptional regulator n=1 Tax=Streptomyces muensis TaxID=1077944 RepID=A0A9X1TLZ1_STRM4|nr:TetR/AcrR family transcriptional regulator [Streptomyces muensis]MCF1595194.1 TetR/AcrR family transcriptional regulator [Streptomyces muensis]